jgi:hypothetical protein
MPDRFLTKVDFCPQDGAFLKGEFGASSLRVLQTRKSVVRVHQSGLIRPRTTCAERNDNLVS